MTSGWKVGCWWASPVPVRGQVLVNTRALLSSSSRSFSEFRTRQDFKRKWTDSSWMLICSPSEEPQLGNLPWSWDHMDPASGWGKSWGGPGLARAQKAPRLPGLTDRQAGRGGRLGLYEWGVTSESPERAPNQLDVSKPGPRCLCLSPGVNTLTLCGRSWASCSGSVILKTHLTRTAKKDCFFQVPARDNAHKSTGLSTYW